MTVGVATAILRAKRNRLIVKQLFKASLPVGLYLRRLLGAQLARVIHCERRHNLHVGEKQRPMDDGEEQLVQGSVDAAGGVVLLRAADGNSQQIIAMAAPPGKELDSGTCQHTYV